METTTTSTVPFDWVRHISRALLQLDEVPLLGSPKPFPWDELADKFAKKFELSELQISPTDWRWRSSNELVEGLGLPLRTTTLAIAPLSGSAWWMMSEEDWQKLMGWMLSKTTEKLPLLDEEYLESFYRFVILETIHFYHELGPSGPLSPALTTNTDGPSGDALCMDISSKFQKQTLWGRLAISPEIRKGFKEFYASLPAPSSTAIAQDLEVTVCLDGGRAKMTLEEWQKVSLGDFLLLDTCTVDPVGEKQRVALTINGQTILRGKIRKDKLKIMDYPLTYEVDTTMADDIPEAEEEQDEFAEFDNIEEEFHEAFEETHDEHQAEESQVEESQIESETIHDTPSDVHAATPVSGQESSSKTLTPGEIPMMLTVEIARLKMSAQTLMHLQPGNFLDLEVHPEQGVNLTVNGRIIGRGELLRLGDTLGVRVLEIK